MRKEEESKKPAFIAAAHLGKVAKYLRFAGYDTLFSPDRSSRELPKIAEREHRILLSRSGRLPKHPFLRPVVETELPEILTELAERFGLEEFYDPFSRCMVCNTPLEPLSPSELPPSVPPAVRSRSTEFRRCPGCGRVYWRGSHYRKMDEYWRRIFARLGD